MFAYTTEINGHHTFVDSWKYLHPKWLWTPSTFVICTVQNSNIFWGVPWKKENHTVVGTTW